MARFSDEKPKTAGLFRSIDFEIADDESHCICPAGQRLYRNGANCNIGGHRAMKFTGTLSGCGNCLLRSKCLRTPQRTAVRQVPIVRGRHGGAPEKASERTKRRIDCARGRQMISRHFATVEPVFRNLRHNKGLRRFTLRGREKGDCQWKLYCPVHNIEKLAHQGYGR